MTREKIQSLALQSAKDHNYNGVICLDPGTGKSKVAIDCIKQGNFKNILITSPRTNLKENWRNELKKWMNWFEIPSYFSGNDIIRWNFGGNIELVNIQSCYKWYKEEIEQFNLIIFDEIHTCGEEYFNLIKIAKECNIPVLGLTGTPTLLDNWKKEVLYKALPIIYEYYNAESDGITNKINYQVFEYELNDSYKVLTGSKTKKWYAGELTQYTYLSGKYEEAKNKMFELNASNYFGDSLLWMKGKAIRLVNYNGAIIQEEVEATKDQKEWGRKFFSAIKYRKEFLWNLTSSKQIALEIKKYILNPYIKENTLNKVLLFSELTAQVEKLSSYSIHSNNGNSAKEAEVINKELLDKFNRGEIRELSSCLSLTLGLNMVGCTHAVFESYSSSNTNAIQKSKRLARLKIDEIANVIIIKAKNTQMEVWFNEAFKDIEYTIVTDLKDLKL